MSPRNDSQCVYIIKKYNNTILQTILFLMIYTKNISESERFNSSVPTTSLLPMHLELLHRSFANKDRICLGRRHQVPEVIIVLVSLVE